MASEDSAMMGGMPMAGMDGTKETDSMRGTMRMTREMRVQMQTMQKASGEQMMSMIPAHRQRTANLLAEMNSEMRAMIMSGDAGWLALVDSVRQDLIQIPEMKARELADFWPAHEARTTRLLQMHQTMLKDMKM